MPTSGPVLRASVGWQNDGSVVTSATNTGSVMSFTPHIGNRFTTPEGLVSLLVSSMPHSP